MNSTPDPQTTADRSHRTVLAVTVTSRPDGGHYIDQADFTAHVAQWLKTDLKGHHAIAEVTVDDHAAAPVAAPPTGQTDELERLRTENARMRHELEVMYGGAFDSLHSAQPADRAGLRELIAEAAKTVLSRRLGDGAWTGLTADLADAVLAVLPAASEPHRLALSTALGLGTSAPWDAIRERAAELQAEVASLTEASRRLLEQRQEMAEERYAWQERGDRAEERVRALEAGQAALSDTDRKFLAFALDLAADQMASRGDEFGPDDEDAMERLRCLAAETPGPETQGEAEFTEARAAFMQIGRTPSLEGLRAELRIEGWPPVVGRYCGASMGRMHDVPGHEHLLAVDPRLIFEYAATTPAVVAEPGKEN